jgi:predicted metalloprotease with PDZ domain
MTRRFALALAVLITVQLQAATLFVDATDARRGIFHAHVTMPASAGPMTFVYPKWIPGEHTASGPLMQLAGLHVHAGERELEWSRDRLEMFSFHVDVPAGVDEIAVDFDYLSPSTTFSGAGYGESSNATLHLLTIPWNHVVVYPAGTPADRVTFSASLRLPAGWKFDTALPVAKQEGDRIDFQTVSLTTLIDSPLIAGAFVREIPIADEGREHVTLVADSAQALALPDDRIAQLRNLVAETDALFGARHYRTYRWLVALSDVIEPQGLEHHESSDDRAPERSYIDPVAAARYLTVLSHEFTHSWNGKYRRPAGLATPDYQTPMVGELLWVYEGMTRYLGDFVLTARSGLRTPESDREFTAFVAGNLDRNRPGRNWRPLVDTAVAVQSLSEAPSEEVPYRRSLDYYDESLLVWLDVDTTMRSKSGGTKSLDDFCRLFFGPPALAPGATPMVKPYTLDDVVAALNQIVPNDWRAFLEQRVYRVTPHPPLGALEAAGWRLIFNDTPNEYLVIREKTNKNSDLSFSLGVWVKTDGTIADVVYGSPAYAAGLTPGMRITAVNGRKFSDDVLREEVRAAKGSKPSAPAGNASADKPDHPIDITAELGTSTATFAIDYHSGERWPHLERIEGKPDVLSEIMRPRRRQ